MQIRFLPCIKTDCICFDILYVLKAISNFKNLLKIKSITYQLTNNYFLKKYIFSINGFFFNVKSKQFFLLIFPKLLEKDELI